MDLHEHQDPSTMGGQAVTFDLQPGDRLHILHPGQVIAYRGPAAQRSDKLLDIKGIYRKRKLIRSDYSGPCQLVAAFPPSVGLKTLTLTKGSDWLYDFRQLFYYTEGIHMETRVLSMKNMMITRDAVKVKFSGRGQIGVLTQGQVLELPLHPEEPLYVEAGRCWLTPRTRSWSCRFTATTWPANICATSGKSRGTGRSSSNPAVPEARIWSGICTRRTASCGVFCAKRFPLEGFLSNKKGAKPRECCQCYPFGLASSHEFYALSTFRIPGRSGQSARLEGKRDAPERP